MNKLQEKELELLKYFIDVCEKLQLKYYLVCGSALGAVKYGGFIPWDDDIDIAMPREDYEVFVNEAQGILPQNIFVQTYKTDKKFPKIFCKLRNSDTTYIEAEYKDLDINHGVFIDIFALDILSDNEVKQKRFKRKQRTYLRKISCALDYSRSWKSALLCSFYRLIMCHKRTDKLLEKYELLILSMSNEESQILCNFGNFRGAIEPVDKDVYGKGKRMLFEGISIYIPDKYELYLKEKYGNYEEDPPIEAQYGHHFYERLDLDNSYIKYRKR